VSDVLAEGSGRHS